MTEIWESRQTRSAEFDATERDETEGDATVLGVRALMAGWAGMLVGGLAGIAWGMRSATPEKSRNRPLTIDVQGDGQTVYVSAEQWREVQANLDAGFTYDAIPDALEGQFETATPPEAVEA